MVLFTLVIFLQTKKGPLMVNAPRRTMQPNCELHDTIPGECWHAGNVPVPVDAVRCHGARMKEERKRLGGGGGVMGSRIP